MILANTRATGYSLGLVLFWPQEPDKLSTGLIQAISITIRTTDAVPVLTIDKYSVVDDAVSLSIGYNGEILCFLNATLGTSYTVYQLQGASNLFVGGWVGIYPPVPERNINLVGAQINPMYIHLAAPEEPGVGAFTLVDQVVSGGSIVRTVVGSGALDTLEVTNTADVRITSTAAASGGTIYSASVAPAIQRISGVDSTRITHINGNPIGADGVGTITLPANWTAACNNLCARVSNNNTETSCPAVDYITESLGPQNYGSDYPLYLAFSSAASGGGYVRNFGPIYDSTVKFNSEYEPNPVSGGGLAWNEISKQHDG